MTQEQDAKIYCVKHGHADYVTVCMGYAYCGRCGDQIGDTLGGAFNLTKKVITGCWESSCQHCNDNRKKITGFDKIILERLERKENGEGIDILEGIDFGSDNGPPTHTWFCDKCTSIRCDIYLGPFRCVCGEEMRLVPSGKTVGYYLAMVGETEVHERMNEITLDWRKFESMCRKKMGKHLDWTYRDKDYRTLVNGLRKEYNEFRASLFREFNGDINTIHDFNKDELLDIANYCMMLYTVKSKMERAP